MKTRRPKSFAAVSGYKPFNWTRFLMRKRYTVSELEEARSLSGEWVTCACGVQCAALPRAVSNSDRFTRNEPLDHELSRLGMAFHDRIIELRDAVRDGTPFSRRRDAAAATLRAIERRSAKLLRSLG